MKFVRADVTPRSGYYVFNDPVTGKNFGISAATVYKTVNVPVNLRVPGAKLNTSIIAELEAFATTFAAGKTIETPIA